MSIAKTLSQSLHFQPIALAPPRALYASAERILGRWPDVVVEPPERDRERLVGEMRQRLDSEDWSDTPMSLATTAAIALFDEERRGRPDLAKLRHFYYDETRVSDRKVFINTIVAAFVTSYVPGAEHTVSLAEALSHARSRIGARWSTLIDQVPKILDPVEAPHAIAARMVDMTSPWDELRHLGLRSPHAPGLMDYVHLAFVDSLAPELTRRETMQRLFDWLKPEGQQARMSGAAEAICALLSPWLDRAPSSEDERFLTERLVALYGDPRLRSENAVWSSVPRHLRDVIERWLTGENIRFFLDVVSAVEANHMWAPRRKFWLGLHEEKRIDAAWVAFSKEGVGYARRKGASNRTLNYGQQTAGGSRINTSLLILKIGDRIVVEGSHSYKVHIFRADHPKAPKLYQRWYDCEDIRLTAGAWSIPHLGDWQERVRNEIRY